MTGASQSGHTEKGHASAGALNGVRVIDLTQILSGPFCTQMLADQGADVIKVEPLAGDETRRLGPYRQDDEERLFGGYYQSVNRNKRSISLNLKTDEGRERLFQLVETADVLVENYRPGVMDRLGLSYEAVAERNQSIVYAAIRGFGDPRSGESPYVDWPAFDVVAQALGGIMGITGQTGHPIKIGPGVGDTIPAMLTAFGIVTALFETRQSGKGQFVDVAMVDGILALCERIVHQYSFSGEIGKPEGNRHPILCPFGMFEARDGWVSIGAPTAIFWKQICSIIGRPELGEHPDYATNQSRLDRKDEVYQIIEDFTRRHTKVELIEMMGGKIPFGPVYNAADIFQEPHFRTRNMLVDVEQPGSASPVTLAGVPIKMSRTQGEIRRRAPKLGEHTNEILAELGVSAAEIDDMKSRDILK